MIMLIVSAVFVVTSCVLAGRANARFRNERRLPMQWGLTGEVNWSAPRYLALAFFPLSAIAVLGFQTILSINVVPKAAQEGPVLPVLIGTGAALIAMQLLHFWLIAKTLRRDAG